MKNLKLFFVFLIIAPLSYAQEIEEKLEEVKYRNIGPFRGGRSVSSVGVVNDPLTYYMGTAGGGLWKTTNAGVTWTPIFDDQPSYSIGCVTIDPNNSNTIWIGTGENLGGRHFGYGDGVYKSENGGKSWTNMGLKKSEHISTNSGEICVLVCAMSPQ